METRDTLIVGSILLCCGCVGLMVVRLSNPFFKGLGWLGCCFAAGALSAGILASPLEDPLRIVTAYTLILLAYVSLHVCVLELMRGEARVPKLGLTLVVLQLAAYPIFRHFHQDRELSIVTLGVLLAVQALQTVVTLKRSVREGMRAPIWFSIILLLVFAGFNLFRSTAVLVLGTPQDPSAPNPFQVTTAIVFLGVGLGVGFGIFWILSMDTRLKLVHLASTDPLTGVFNRRSFIEWCERELLRSSRTGEPFSLIMIDVDHFKQINDQYGHKAGDAALCAVAEKLKASARKIDILGRWGGEEFVALLPGASSDAALLIAQRLRHSVESLSILQVQAEVLDALPTIAVTISLGVVTYLGHVDHIDELFHRCDEALYRAKADGRNRVVQTGV